MSAVTCSIPGRPQASSKASDEDIMLAYREAGSVWRAADVLGMCGQSVHERLVRLGVPMKGRKYSDEDMRRIRRDYSEYVSSGRLEELAEEMGRPKSSLCKKARDMGLTNIARRGHLSYKSRRAISEARKISIKERGHPRGALGMKHTQATLDKVSEASKRTWRKMSADKKAARTKKIIETKIARYGSAAHPSRAKVSWKSGWRVVDGRRIYFRSRWEYNYSLYLQLLKDNGDIIEWEHEPETFWFDGIRRGCVSFLPDFRVTNRDGSIEYHEVKGWMDARSKTKLRRMKKYHPNVKVLVIGASWFRKNGRKLSFLKGWEK